TSREHAQKFHLILFTLTSGYGFADCERNGHRHDAVIMRAARRTRASVRVPDKGPKLVQQASAVKHLRRFDQHRREPLNHYRPRGSGGQPTPFRPLVVDIRTVLRFQMSQYSMAVIVALDGDQRSVVTRRERDHFASQVARGEMPMQFGALQSRLTLDYLSASIVAFRPSPGRINSNDVIVPIDRRHPGCQTSVFLQLNRLAATFKLTVNKLELKDALSRCSKARDRIFRILLYGEASHGGPDHASIGDLLVRQPPALRQTLLLGCERVELSWNDQGGVTRVKPPGKEMAGVAGFVSPLPFVIKNSRRPVGSRFQHNLAPRRHGSTHRD